MSHPEQESPRDLAAAYALGALGPEEAREFEAFLATSLEAQREVAEYREVTALLGLAQREAAPEPDVRARILRRVGEDSVGSRSGAPRIVWYALAASLLLALGLGALVLSLRREIGERDAAIAARDQELAQRRREIGERDAAIAARDQELAQRQQEVAERQAILNAILDPGVRLYQLTSSGDPEPNIQLFWNQRRNEALLNASRLKPVPAGRAYQLWFIKDGKPVPSVTFTPKPNGAATVGQVRVPSGKISAAAITVEPASGSKQPTSPILLTGTL